MWLKFSYNGIVFLSLLSFENIPRVNVSMMIGSIEWLRFLAATKQLYEWSFPSVCLSVCPSVTPFSPCSHHHIIMKFSGVVTNDRSDVHAKGQGQRSRSQRSWPHLGVSGLSLQFEFTYGDEIMHKAWCCLEEVPYWFSRSSVKFRGHTAKNPNWLF